MSAYISSALRQQILSRTKNRCAYYHLSQAGQEAVFHIDHVHPVKSGGQTIFENLALAGGSYSLITISKSLRN